MSSDPEAPENEGTPVVRDPSYPDRARIDSDVRAFLRPVSTPWIVFDRDSRVDDFAKSALRSGAVFASSPNFRPEVIEAAQSSGRSLEDVVATPLPGLEAPPSVKAIGEGFRPGAVLEPAMSSVLPSQGVFPEPELRETTSEPSTIVATADVGFEPEPEPRRASGRTRVIAICAALSVAALAAAIVGRPKKPIAVVDTPIVAALPPAAPASLPSAVPAALSPSETMELDDGPVTGTAKKTTEPKRGFGKLTIRDAARHKNVYFDGKRMLGQGQRSFLVFCGMHTLAVNDKTEARDIEVPCNGEFNVSK